MVAAAVTVQRRGLVATDAINDRRARRPVELSGYGLFEDGTTFPFTVQDLSYGGCKIDTKMALVPGARLRISISGLGRAVEAGVRWSRDGQAGLRFDPDEASETKAAPRRRLRERPELVATVLLRRFGRCKYQARLFDLTCMGCKVEFIERPRVGEVAWVTLDGLSSIEVSVRWVEGHYGGLEFARPIHPAVYDMLCIRLLK